MEAHRSHHKEVGAGRKSPGVRSGTGLGLSVRILWFRLYKLQVLCEKAYRAGRSLARTPVRESQRKMLEGFSARNDGRDGRSQND